MTNKDQGDHYKITLNLVKKFVESNQRKRINLLSDIESEVENLFLFGNKLFDWGYRSIAVNEVNNKIIKCFFIYQKYKIQNKDFYLFVIEDIHNNCVW